MEIISRAQSFGCVTKPQVPPKPQIPLSRKRGNLVPSVSGSLRYAAIQLLSLAAKRRERGYCNRLAIFVRPSVATLLVLNGKGRLRENMHSRYIVHKGIVVM